MASLPPLLTRTSLCALLLASAAGCAGGGQRGADAASRLRIASVAEASGQTDVAISVLTSLAGTAPDNVEVQARYARALARSGRIAEAEAVVSQTLRRKPGDPVMLTELGRIRLLEGRAADAAEAFGAVVAARPRELGAVLGQGIAQDLLGRHPEAQASYRAVLAADPQHMPALNNLALSMVLAGDPGGAVPVLQRLATRADAPPRVRNNLSVAQAAAGDRVARLSSPVAAASPPPEPRFAERALPPVAAPAARAPALAAVPDQIATTTLAAYTGGVVAMEPIPDRPQRPKPAPIASSGRANPIPAPQPDSAQ
jgi:Flp pilus assembly protein TadD